MIGSKLIVLIYEQFEIYLVMLSLTNIFLDKFSYL